MPIIRYQVVPRIFNSDLYTERLSDCLWRLDKNNPEKNKTYHHRWINEPFYFIYNRNYRDKKDYINQVIFSVGFLKIKYIKLWNIDPIKQPYWCSKVRFDDYLGQIFIHPEDIHEWQYNPNIERDKKTGWIYRTDLRDIFSVVVDLYANDR